ncbi:MAG: hypothetical protein AAGJ40_05480 [Planctomycetota bacterium]
MSKKQCPICGGDMYRTHRRWYERMFFVVRAYQCNFCQARFTRRSMARLQAESGR